MGFASCVRCRRNLRRAFAVRDSDVQHRITQSLSVRRDDPEHVGAGKQGECRRGGVCSFPHDDVGRNRVIAFARVPRFDGTGVMTRAIGVEARDHLLAFDLPKPAGAAVGRGWSREDHADVVRRGFQAPGVSRAVKEHAGAGGATKPGKQGSIGGVFEWLRGDGAEGRLVDGQRVDAGQARQFRGHRLGIGDRDVFARMPVAGMDQDARIGMLAQQLRQVFGLAGLPRLLAAGALEFVGAR
jgi:hypothetical protein